MKNEWQTPDWLFNIFDAEFNFGLDVAATKENSKCDAYFDKEQNALTKPWHYKDSTVWCNPPYQQPLQGEFLKYADLQARKYGITVCCLIPSVPETKRWVQHVSLAQEIRFLYPRISFIDPDTGKPKGKPKWGVALVVYRSPVGCASKPLCTWQEVREPGSKTSDIDSDEQLTEEIV